MLEKPKIQLVKILPPTPKGMVGFSSAMIDLLAYSDLILPILCLEFFNTGNIGIVNQGNATFPNLYLLGFGHCIEEKGVINSKSVIP